MTENETALVPVPVLEADLVVRRAPDVVLAEAQKAAQAIKKVLDAKPKKVMMGGEVYLEFEDWQTLGRFFGVTAKVTSSRPVQFGEVTGWEATAVVLLTSSDQVISQADSMCLTDEPNWKARHSFQLRSMAQTRACSKALRQVLSWVVVLAGYKPTPAEEIIDLPGASREPQDAKPVANPTAPISDRDRKRLWAILYGRAKELGIEKKVMTDQFHAWLTEMYNVHRTEQITNANYERIIAAVQAWPAQADQPTAQEIFGEDKVPF